MARISIDVTPEEHQKLKALAALQGKSIKVYVLENTIGACESSESDALRELEALLDERVRRTKREGVARHSAAEIFQKVLDGSTHDPDA